MLLRSLELIKIKTPDNQYTFHDHPEVLKIVRSFEYKRSVFQTLYRRRDASAAVDHLGRGQC